MMLRSLVIFLTLFYCDVFHERNNSLENGDSFPLPRRQCILIDNISVCGYVEHYLRHVSGT